MQTAAKEISKHERKLPAPQKSSAQNLASAHSSKINLLLLSNSHFPQNNSYNKLKA